jgi:hypothetical protein
MTRTTMPQKVQSNLAPRNPIVGFLVSHPNRGTKKHKDKKKESRMPTAGQVKRLLEQEDSQEK